jgi:hypothetical protein
MAACICCSSCHQGSSFQDWDSSNNGVSDDLLIMCETTPSISIALAIMEEGKIGCI